MKILNSTILFVLLYASIAGAQPFAYITNAGSDNVSVINSQTNKVIATIPVGSVPFAGGLFITNEIPEVAVPTLGAWSVIALVGILGISGLIAIRRKAVLER